MKNPYYEHGGQTIYHGDCFEVMKQFPDKSFDLVLTDPPYGKMRARCESAMTKLEHTENN